MKIEIMVGMIASGKSTYARKRAREGALIVSHDDLSEMLHGEYRYESGLRECYRAMEESLVEVAFNHGRDVVIDRTHLTKESRKRWLEFAGKEPGKDFCHEITAVVFPVECAESHAIRRFAFDARGRSYEDWLAVATHHHAQATAEPVTEDEGFDRIVYQDKVDVIMEGENQS